MCVCACVSLRGVIVCKIDGVVAVSAVSRVALGDRAAVFILLRVAVTCLKT